MGERAGVIIDGSKKRKVQTQVDGYTKWLIQNLRGSGMGSTEGRVLAAIIDQWMVANRDYLNDLGLWPPQVRAGKAVVLPPGA